MIGLHTYECEYCGTEYYENDMYYDDICDDCAEEEGLL